MSWALSLNYLANQAEEFLDQVDQKVGDSLNTVEGNNSKNIFHSLTNSLETSSSDTVTDAGILIEQLEDRPTGELPPSERQETNSDESVMSSAEVIPSPPREDAVPLGWSDLQDSLLRQELTQLTEELSLMSQKLRASQEEGRRGVAACSSLSSALEARGEELGELQRSCASLRESNSDMTELLAAKDSQIEVLKIRLTEADTHLSSQTGLLEKLQEEARETVGLCKTLRQLESEAENSQNEMTSLREKMSLLQKTAHQKEQQLQGDIAVLSESLQDAENKLALHTAKHTRVTEELRRTRTELDQARADLLSYRERATRVLQAKETGEGEEPLLDNDSVEVLLYERNSLQEQLRALVDEGEDLRAQLAAGEEAVREGQRAASEQTQTALDTLRQRDATIADLKTTLTNLQEELAVTQRELVSLRTRKASPLPAVDLPAQTTAPLEDKIKGLTEVLLAKQSEVERLNSERSGLVIQMEGLESLLQAAEKKANANHTQHVTVSVPMEMGRVGRGRAALGTLDRMGVRLGTFLRRYPTARLMVLGYMFLLHSWVMVILLTYSPEIHDHSAIQTAARDLMAPQHLS